MVEFLNIFIMPFIAVNTIYKRKNEEIKLDAGFIVRYALCTIAVYVGTYMVMAVTSLAFGIMGDSTSNLYSFVAILVSLIIPYIFDIFCKYLKISVELKENEDESKK